MIYETSTSLPLGGDIPWETITCSLDPLTQLEKFLHPGAYQKLTTPENRTVVVVDHPPEKIGAQANQLGIAFSDPLIFQSSVYAFKEGLTIRTITTPITPEFDPRALITATRALDFDKIHANFIQKGRLTYNEIKHGADTSIATAESIFIPWANLTQLSTENKNLLRCVFAITSPPLN